MHRLISVLGLVAMLATASRAHAQTVRTWNVTSGTWSSTGSWDGAFVPTASETAYFSSAAVGSSNATVFLTGTASVGGLSFNNSGSTTLRSDNTTTRVITLGTGGITVASTAGPVTFSPTISSVNYPVSVALTGTQTWTNNSSSLFDFRNGIDSVSTDVTLTVAGSGSTNVLGTISGSAGRRIAIVKQGTGVLTLGGTTSTYSGGFTLSEGTVRFNGGVGALGTGTFTILGGAIDTASQLTLNATPQAWNGDFAFLGSGGAGTSFNLGTGTVTLGGTRTVTNNSANSLTVGGPIRDGGNGYGLTKSGTGTLILTGSSSYTGPTTISAGRLQIGSSGTIGSIAASSTVSIGSGGVLVFSRTDDYGGAFSNQITGAGSISLAVGGTTTLSNSSNDFSGGIAFNQVNSSTVTLQFTSPQALGSGVVSHISNNSVLRAGVSGTIVNPLSIANNGVFRFDTQSQSVTVSGTTGGSGVLTKIGSGTLTLTGTANSISYAANEGRLRLAGAARLGTTGTFNSTISGSSGAVFEYASSVDGGISGALSGGFSFVKSGPSSLALSTANTFTGGLTLSAGTLVFGNNSALGTGTFTINGGSIESTLTAATGNTRMTPQAWNTDFTFVRGSFDAGSGAVSINDNRVVTIASGTFGVGGIGDGGNGYGLTKAGPGTLIIQGSSSYTGPTTISGGMLQIGAVFGGTTGALAASSTVSISSGALLNFSRTDNYGGAFSNRITGAGSLAISSGTLTLSNSANDFSGGITVGGGKTLQFDSPQAIGTGTVTLNASSVLRAGSSGTLVNNVVVPGAIQGDFDTQSQSVTLSGTVTNTASNGTFRKLGSGTLAFSGVVDANLRIGGGVVRISEAGTMTSTRGIASDGGGGVFEYASSANSTISTISGTLSVLKAGAGSLTLIGANTFINGLTLSEGTLNMDHANALGAASSVFTITGGTIGNTATTTRTISNNNNQSWNGDFAFAGPWALNLGTGTVTLGATRTVSVITSSTGASQNHTLTVAGPIRDGGNGYGLTKAGDGTLVLSGSSSYSGPTTVTGGTLTVSNTFALGSGAAALDINGGVLALSNSGTGIHVSRSGPITLAGGTISSGTFTNTGSALDARSGAISSVLAGTLGLTKTTSGTVALSGANTFSGGVALSAGQLNLNAAAALGTGTFTISGGVLGNSTGSAVSTNTANAHLWNGDFGFAGPTALTLGSGTVTLGATRTVTVTSSTLTVAIPITGAAGLGLTKTGAGTLVLSGSNGYTGTTTVNDGVLTLETTNRYTGLTQVNGGVLNVVGPAGLYAGNTADWTKENITVGPGGVLSVRTGTGNFTTANVTTLLTNLGGLGGAVNNNGFLAGSAIGFDTTLATGTVGNVIADSTGPGGGAIGLVKYGGNTLLLTGSNTYTGTTSITSGTLRIGTTGRIAGPIANAAALLISNTSVTLPGLITGTGSLTTSGTGTVTLSNASSVFDGPITIPGGSLESAALGGTGAINLGSAAVTGTFRYIGGDGTTNKVVNLAGNSSGGGTLDASGSGTVAFLGGATGNVGTTLTLAGVNTGANYIQSITGSNVVKTGPGTWVFGSNSFVGQLAVQQGTIVASINAPGGSGTSSALGKENGPIPVVGLANSTGTAALLAASGVTISRVIEVAALGSGNQEVVLGGSGAGEATFDASTAFRLGRGVTLAADPGGNVRFLTPSANWQQQNGSPDPAVAITIGTPAATGTVTLETTLPGSIQSVTVRQGTLRLGNGTTVGALGPSSTLSGSAGATLAFDRSDTINSGVDFAASIAGAMNVTQLGSGTVVLAGVNTYTGTTSIAAGTVRVSGSGRIADSARIDVGAAGRIVFDRSDDYGGAYDGKLAGSGLLTVQSGSLTLTGLNTFTGTSAVLAGAVLKLDGQINNTALSVDSGATLMGSGTILGTTTIAGLHSPGSSPGIQSFGNLAYTAGASVQWELWGNTILNTASPPDYDQILLSGNLDFSGATTFELMFTGSQSPTNYSEVAWSDAFWDTNREWLVYDVAGTTTGFGDLTLATTNWQDGSGAFFNTARPMASFELQQRTNDVYLVYTVVPEPGTLALAAIGLAAAAYCHRRRCLEARSAS